MIFQQKDMTLSLANFFSKKAKTAFIEANTTIRERPLIHCIKYQTA